ncbi:hypothetical protein AMELA_G00253890 [Ameiurus melas]|uniref:Uncharacterized protein n=1 Tax=Ameiurus melas TaxID=219545 RepID=A0A7J5ZSV6_AMEME|nr:hypothetical protein AMELA_G00253890 [Ameiurus melas]
MKQVTLRNDPEISHTTVHKILYCVLDRISSYTLNENLGSKTGLDSLDKELRPLEAKVPYKVSQLCLNLISNSDQDTFSAVLEQC